MVRRIAGASNYFNRLALRATRRTEDAPVHGSEWVLRRIPDVQPPWCNPEQERPVAVGAFTPNSGDADGISLYREIFVKPEEVAAAARKSRACFVVRLRAKDVRKLGLSLAPRLDEDLPGHVVVPELYYGMPRPRKTELRARLAELVSRDDIVYSPTSRC